MFKPSKELNPAILKFAGHHHAANFCNGSPYHSPLPKHPSESEDLILSVSQFCNAEAQCTQHCLYKDNSASTEPYVSMLLLQGSPVIPRHTEVICVACHALQGCLQSQCCAAAVWPFEHLPPPCDSGCIHQPQRSLGPPERCEEKVGKHNHSGMAAKLSRAGHISGVKTNIFTSLPCTVDAAVGKKKGRKVLPSFTHGLRQK